jgi:hypothetical protein
MQQIQTASVRAPGFLGLNLQDSVANLDAGYALEADNCIVDQKGRIGSRRGWKALTSSIGSYDIESIAEFIDYTDTSTVFACANKKIYRLDGQTLTEITYSGDGDFNATDEITANNWKQVSLNGRHYFFQEGHKTLVYDPDVSTENYNVVNEVIAYQAFSESLGTCPEASTAISAYGRIWAAGMANDKDLLCFSDLLDGNVWATGTAGTLDVATVWADGSDAIQALAAFNNYLFIFGKRQILIYRGAEDPSTMYLEDIVKGIGCVARDTVAYTGSDVIFLSEVGVMSLLRTIQEKSAPLRDLSMNVRDELVANINSEQKASIKSAYYARDAFYILHLPSTGKTYCFDTRRPMENGGLRVTTWTGINPKAIAAISDNKLLFGKSGVIGLYFGYSDNGNPYTFSYKSTHFEMDRPTNLKILKKVGGVFIGGNNQEITTKWAYNYEEVMEEATANLKSEKVAEYGIDEYGIGEYSDGTVLDDITVNTTGNGDTVQIGFEAIINGIFVSLQRIDVFYKFGKIKL